MPEEFKFDTKKIITQSQGIVDLLESMDSPPTKAQKISLKLALEKCSALTLCHMVINKAKGNIENYIPHLFEALQTNTTIKHLDLRLCNLSLKHVNQLARALNQNKTLKYLDLSLNPEALQDPSPLIKETRLKSLILNTISYNGFKAVSDALKTNTTLIHLGLGFRPIDKILAKNLIQALKTNKNLLQLDLQSTSFTDGDVAAQIEDIIFARKSFIWINLENAFLSGEHATIKKIVDSIEAKEEGPATNLFLKTSPGYNALSRAVNKHYFKASDRAYALGKALHDSKLNKDTANIVAEYLDYKDSYEFKTGFKGKPYPYASSLSDKIVHGLSFLCSAGLLVTILGASLGIFPVTITGLSAIAFSLTLLGCTLAYELYKNKKQSQNTQAKEKANTSAPDSTAQNSHPSVSNTATVPLNNKNQSPALSQKPASTKASKP